MVFQKDGILWQENLKAKLKQYLRITYFLVKMLSQNSKLLKINYPTSADNIQILTY